MRWNRSLKRCKDAIEFAQFQRATMNGHARAMWQMLRKRQCRGMKFCREHPIPPYTADFCCIQLRLIIEVDGEHHYTTAGKRHDLQRDKFLFSRGYTVLRIPGYDVDNDPRAVFQRIEQAIDRLLDSDEN